MLPYSTTLFGHQLAASFLIIGLYFCFEATQVPRVRNFSLGAFFLGLMVMTEFTTAPLALVLWVFVGLRKKRQRAFLLGSLVTLVPLTLILVHNRLSFGSAFTKRFSAS